MRNILALDPGKTTGWATWDDEVFRSGELEFQEAVDYAEKWMYDNYQLSHVGVVLCERFVISQRTITVAHGDTNWSIETIGACRWLAHRYEQTFGLVNAAEAKKFADDDFLKHWNWYKRGQGHANDASRVLAVGLSQMDPRTWKQMVLGSGLLLTEDSDDSATRDRP